jgi:DNA gyrase inhibitor GyrI
MTMTFENIPSYTISYIRSVGPYGVGNARAMEALKSWARSRGLLTDDAVILGIALDDPSSTRPEDCRYDVCLVVPGSFTAGDGSISSGSLSGGKYAVFRIPHTAQAVQQAWTDIFPELSKQRCQLDQMRPILERYPAALVKEHECELCVPVS